MSERSVAMQRRRLNVLFLCTGNACRSQMAEGWTRHLGGGRIEARSAGIEAHGLNPRAVAAMAEAGIDISHQRSKRLDHRMIEWADLIVTVCGDADARCPVLPAGTRREYWPIEDPAKARGDEAQVAATFRAVRDEIERRVRGLIARLEPPAPTRAAGTDGIRRCPSR